MATGKEPIIYGISHVHYILVDNEVNGIMHIELMKLIKFQTREIKFYLDIINQSQYKNKYIKCSVFSES